MCILYIYLFVWVRPNIPLYAFGEGHGQAINVSPQTGSASDIENVPMVFRIIVGVAWGTPLFKIQNVKSLFELESQMSISSF